MSQSNSTLLARFSKTGAKPAPWGMIFETVSIT
jgi:hypothetical protein